MIKSRQEADFLAEIEISSQTSYILRQQFVECPVDFFDVACWCSSAVEQRFRKPQVVGSNPTASSKDRNEKL